MDHSGFVWLNYLFLISDYDVVSYRCVKSRRIYSNSIWCVWMVSHVFEVSLSGSSCSRKQKYNIKSTRWRLTQHIEASPRAHAEHQLAWRISCYVENWQIYVSTDVCSSQIYDFAALHAGCENVHHCHSPSSRSTRQISSCLWAASQSPSVYLSYKHFFFFFSIELTWPNNINN